MEDTNQPEILQTPPSLRVKVEASLRAYRMYSAGTKTVQDSIAGLHDPDWEVRCAAVEALGASDPQSSRAPLLEALSDENRIVRSSAVCHLGRMGNMTPIDRLLLCLQDREWQVREMAVLTLGKLGYTGARQQLEEASNDSNSEVRTAAELVLQTFDRSIPKRPAAAPPVVSNHALQVTSPQSRKERKSHLMKVIQQAPASPDQQASVASSGITIPLSSRKRKAPRKLLLIVAAAIFMLALTAGGVGYSWWNTTFGNPNLYQTVAQQQTDQGVTVAITKVYADEGRTVIAYDTYAANHAQNVQFFIDNYNIQGSAPTRAEGVTQATYGDALQEGVTHFYMVQPAFLVPANINTVTINLDIQRTIVNQPGKGPLPEISGHWHFSFTVPFHHENNRNLPNPLDGQTISG